MTIRGIPLRAILIPLGVAAFSVGALAWYALVKIPSQERYLNEQNIRLLRTTTAEIQTKVNNFDYAIDHALESFEFGQKKNGPVYSEDFNAYVKLFVDLDIVAPEDEQGTVCHKDGKELYSDPPRAKIEADEGTHYLDLCYQRDSRKISAKADIERIVSGYLSSRTEFDTVALVDSRARVIAQYPTSGLELSRLDQLAIAAGAASPGQGAPRQSDTAPNALDALRASGNMADVRLAGADYRLYVQPVPLSLKNEAGDDSAEWALCGLMRLDHFRTASSAISSTYWLMMIAAVVVLCTTIPLLKLQALNARERFHGRDGVFVAGSTFVIAGLLTFVLLDVYYFGYVSTTETDGQLQELGKTIQHNLQGEVEAARNELKKTGTKLIADAGTEAPGRLDPKSPRITFHDQKLRCEPAKACRESVLNDQEIRQVDPYPFFNIVAGTDIDGGQQIKWTTAKGVTPFINISDEKLEYFRELDTARRLQGVPGVPQSGIAVVQSPNTGEPLTVFWEAVDEKKSKLTAISLATSPISVGRSVLPKGMRFAILGPDGQVLFHSDPKRSLHENFFNETGNNSRLRALVVGRKSDFLQADYLGDPHRFLVTPIVLTSDPSAPFLDPQWSLVVFQDSLIPETINIEMVTVATFLFIAYALLVAGIWFIAYRIHPRSVRKWFWPDHRKVIRYRRAAQFNLIAVLVYVALIAFATPGWLIAGAVLVSLAALGITFRIITQSRLLSAFRSGWENDFLLARILVLFVVAAMPAIVSFKVAHDFEARLLNRRAYLDLQAELNARTERIVTDTATLELCNGYKQDSTCSGRTAAFLDKRLKIPWDIHAATPTSTWPSNGLPQPASSIDRFLSFGHLPYNPTAIDLNPSPFAVVESRPKNAGAWTIDGAGNVLTMGQGQMFLPFSMLAKQGAGFSSLIVGAAVAICLWLLVWFAACRLFILELYVRPGVRALDGPPPSGNLLLIGPPGSGKSRMLGEQPNISIFDVKTSGSWLHSGAPLRLPEGSMCAIDHLEHRFEDMSFRQRLLVLLNGLLYTRHCRVWITSARDPLEQLQESGAADLDAWRRLLQSFRLQVSGITRKPDAAQIPEIESLVLEKTGVKAPHLVQLLLDECSLTPWLLSIGKQTLERLPALSMPTREELLFEIGVAAEPFYRSVWSACSKDEKLTIRQLAKEGVVNPCNQTIVGRLVCTGLIWRDPYFRVINESFRRFVLQERQAEGLDAREHEGVQWPWSSVTATILTLALGLFAGLVLTSQQLVESWLGYAPALIPAFLPALAPAFPTLARLAAGIQRTGKPAQEATG